MLKLLVFSVIGLACAENCGRKLEQPPWESPDEETYIVGGRDAAGQGYWPWQLSLQFLRENTIDDYTHTCGAVYVDDDFILTAAHCVEGRMVGLNDSRRDDPENFRLVFGGFNASDLTGNEVYRNIDMIIKHERWRPDPYNGYPNDIALLRMTEPMEDDEPNIVKACLPKKTFMNFTGNANCWITGWGKLHFQDSWIPDVLQEANIIIPSNEICNDGHFGYIRESHICVGDGRPNACSGDSGGPLSCYVEDEEGEGEGKWYVAGLTSWGLATCSVLPGVYTRTSSFWEWTAVQMELNRP